MMGKSIDIASQVMKIKDQIMSHVERQLESRSNIAANELRNSAGIVLGGIRIGRKYNLPGTGEKVYDTRTKRIKVKYQKYKSSTPGEPPAARTGVLRDSWRPIAYGKKRLGAAIESNVKYAGYLEDGTKKMWPRKYERRIIEHAKPKIQEIYSQPFAIEEPK